MPAFSSRAAWVKRDDDRHRRQAGLLLGLMLTLLMASGWLLGGGVAMLAIAGATLAGLGAMWCIPAAAVMVWYRAEPLVPPVGPADLPATLADYAARAGLRDLPVLYHLPGAGFAAMAVGDSGGSAIALSDDALDGLSARERRAVLAHEVSHIASGDTRLLALTCVISRLGQGAAECTLIAALIFVAAADTPVLSAWQVVGLMIMVPAMSLLHLALSRNREFAADLAAVRLTGDALGLIAALERIEAVEMLPRSGTLARLACLLRSHPSPGRRIASLADRFYPAPRGRTSLGWPVFYEVAAAARRRRSGGLTMPPDMTTFSPSSTVMSSTTTSFLGTNSR